MAQVELETIPKAWALRRPVELATRKVEAAASLMQGQLFHKLEPSMIELREFHRRVASSLSRATPMIATEQPLDDELDFEFEASGLLPEMIAGDDANQTIQWGVTHWEEDESQGSERGTLHVERVLQLEQGDERWWRGSYDELFTRLFEAIRHIEDAVVVSQGTIAQELRDISSGLFSTMIFAHKCLKRRDVTQVRHISETPAA